MMTKRFVDDAYALLLLAFAAVLYVGVIIVIILIFRLAFYALAADMVITGIATGLLSIMLFIGMIESFESKEPFGIDLKRKDHLKLYALVEDISKSVGTKKPDRIILVPYTEIGVKGMFKRTLVIGMASLRAITIEDFKAILSHEFGHFGHADTKISSITSIVGRSFENQKRLIQKKGVKGSIIWIILNLISYIVINIISYIFLFAYASFSRRREMLADQTAANITSPHIFSSALLEYAAYTTYFNALIPNLIIDGLKKRKIVVNIYKTNNDFWKHLKPAQRKNIETGLLKIKSTFISTHPSLNERIKRLKRLNFKKNRKPKTKSIKKALTLIKDAENIEKDFSKIFILELGTKAGLLDMDDKGKIRFTKIY